MDTNEILSNLAKKYECKTCHFVSSNKTNFNIHMETKKHKKQEILMNTNPLLQNLQKAQDDTLFFCECGKSYKHNPSLYNHKKKCNENKNQEIILSNNNNEKEDDINYKELIKTLLEQNNVVKHLLEQNTSLQNTIKDLIPKVGNNNNSNNTNSNNNFNVCLFLNEKCKDAISMDEFIKKIEITVSDLLFTKQKGLVNGISNIFIKHLTDLPEKKRPLWCSDKKRKKIFIKEEKWSEDINNVKTKKAIHDVTYIQAKNTNKYISSNPDWNQKDSKKDEYIGIVKNTTETIVDKENNVIHKLVDTIYLDDDCKKMIE
jgi:hypothetical protein